MQSNRGRSRLSLAPLSLEDALRGAMQVDPTKIPDSPMPKKRKARKKKAAKRRK